MSENNIPVSKIVEILEKIKSGVDFTAGHKLIDENYLDSFDVVELAGELMDAFDIQLSVEHLTPENMNSPEAIAALVEKLQG